MRICLVILILCGLPLVTASSQDEAEESEPFELYSDSLSWLDTLAIDPDQPTVSFKTDNFYLLRSIFPDHYDSEYRIRRDIRSVVENDTLLATWWDSLGVSVLGLTELFSGIEWIENTFDIHLVKYLPVDGMFEPIVLPYEGIRRRGFIEAAPGGMHRQLNLLKLVASRNLRQLLLATYQDHYITGHPFLEDGSYRFDIMSLALAVECAEYLLPGDSLKAIFKSETWLRYNPGWELFNSHFRYAWELTPETPLLFYIAREPYNSPLVALTVPPRVRRSTSQKRPSGEPAKLSAGSGRLGFSVMRTPRGYLEVVDIDTLGLAFANGLMIGDKIKRVNGEYARNARELMARILDKLDTEGVYLIAVRDDEEIGLLLLPASDNE
ncbi:MAG: hypothetical protein JSV44_08350 [Candidatus Zixiibacteriota bacterium]|nr:MAG: hypothetical protein JSV44_08350 [candidate division Zixibacteria bacterium]